METHSEVLVEVYAVAAEEVTRGTGGHAALVGNDYDPCKDLVLVAVKEQEAVFTELGSVMPVMEGDHMEIENVHKVGLCVFPFDFFFAFPHFFEGMSLILNHKTNVVGTLNMLRLAKRVGAQFLLTSMSEVYGDLLQHPQNESYSGNGNRTGVRSCYDEGKQTAETLTMDYHRGAKLEVRIARIVNTYGPRMCIDDGRVVSNFVAQVVRVAVMAFRNLSNKRNFAAEMIFFDALQVLLDDAAHLLLNVTHLGTGLALKDGLVLDRLLQGALESQEDGSDVTECIARALLAFSKERILEMAAAAQLCSEVSENQHVSSGVVEFDFESGDESCAEDSALAEGSEYAGRIGAATDEVASEGDSDCASGAALCDGALADACYSFSANVV